MTEAWILTFLGLIDPRNHGNDRILSAAKALDAAGPQASQDDNSFPAGPAASLRWGETLCGVRVRVHSEVASLAMSF
jgi:hypothetical protein